MAALPQHIAVSLPAYRPSSFFFSPRLCLELSSSGGGAPSILGWHDSKPEAYR